MKSSLPLVLMTDLEWGLMLGSKIERNKNGSLEDHESRCIHLHVKEMMIKSSKHTKVGLNVGLSVGLNVGLNEGDSVGSSVGFRVVGRGVVGGGVVGGGDGGRVGYLVGG